MARLLTFCAVVVAALLLAAPAAAEAQGSKRAAGAVFSASLAPLPNTTGVNLGGSGFARIALNMRGDNQFTLDVKDLGSPIVAVHIHKGLPSENGSRAALAASWLRCWPRSGASLSLPRRPIFLAVCGNTPAFQVQVVRNAAGKSGGASTETVSRCSQARRETYTALPLATPKVAGADSLAAAFDAIKADPFGFYANVHTEESEKRVPDAGQIRGQLRRES